MTNKYKKIIYYSILIIIFLFIDKLINYFPAKSYDDYMLIKQENKTLKDDIKYLSNINYDNYKICKININNLYESNTYYLKCDFNTNNNIVLNDIGFIGLANNNKLILAKDLVLSIRINNNKGILKDNKISIIHDDYAIDDKIYVNYLNEEYLIGYVSNIINNGSYDIISVKYINISNSYVVVLDD